MIAIFLLAFTLSLFSFGTTPAAAGDVAGVSTHLFLTVLRDYDHDAAFSVTYTDALGTHTKPYHAGMEVTAWSPVTITCTNHHVYDWSIDADVQEATIVGVGGITYPGGTGIHVKGTNTIKAFATNFGLHYINIVVILGEGNDNGGDNGGGDNGGDNGGGGSGSGNEEVYTTLGTQQSKDNAGNLLANTYAPEVMLLCGSMLRQSPLFPALVSRSYHGKLNEYMENTFQLKFESFGLSGHLIGGGALALRHVLDRLCQ